MLNKDQKQIIVGCVALIIILGAISAFSHPKFQFVDTTDYSKYQAPTFDKLAYEKYLASLQVDPQASQQLFQQLISQADIEAKVKQQLKTDQPVAPAAVDEKSLALSKQSGQQAVVTYLTDSATLARTFGVKNSELNQKLFAQDQQQDQELLTAISSYKSQLIKIPVPKEALGLQKDLVSAVLSYEKLAQLSQNYDGGTNTNPWADMYQNYAAINDRLIAYHSDLTVLAGKYKIAELPVTLHYAEESVKPRFTLVPEAQAAFGIGDITITVGDIPRIIEQAVADGLTASFSQFLGSFLQQMLQKIQSNYMISNFLYYSDALVSGEYVDDYLNKYVGDNLDKQIIKKFIPQLSCGQQNADLKPLFQAKAQEYLGFNPTGLDPKDPQFYQKMARVGDFLSSPEGWQEYYQGVAQQAQSEAEKAAAQELSSPGIKTPRDINSRSISASIETIVSSQQATMSALMNLGISSAGNFISKFVAQLTQTLMSQFVFPGVTVSPRGPSSVIGVLKEQATCLAAGQVQAVVPISTTQYVSPPSGSTAPSLLLEYCNQYPELCSATSTPAVGK